MICEVDYDILTRKYDLAILNDEQTKCYVLQPMAIALEEGKEVTVTKMQRGFAEAFFSAMGVMLQKRGEIPQSAVDAELKATKEHLADFQRLVYERRTK